MAPQLDRFSDVMVSIDTLHALLVYQSSETGAAAGAALHLRSWAGAPLVLRAAARAAQAARHSPLLAVVVALVHGHEVLVEVGAALAIELLWSALTGAEGALPVVLLLLLLCWLLPLPLLLLGVHGGGLRSDVPRRSAGRAPPAAILLQCPLHCTAPLPLLHTEGVELAALVGCSPTAGVATANATATSFLGKAVPAHASAQAAQLAMGKTEYYGSLHHCARSTQFFKSGYHVVPSSPPQN